MVRGREGTAWRGGTPAQTGPQRPQAGPGFFGKKALLQSDLRFQDHLDHFRNRETSSFLFERDETKKSPGGAI